MKLDSNYQLISDDYNYILQKKLPKRNKERAKRSREWRNVGYWKDLGQALQAYARCVTRAKLPTTFDELLALEHALSTQIEAIGERCVSLWGKGS